VNGAASDRHLERVLAGAHLASEKSIVVTRAGACAWAEEP
jgi:hypothetical protein